MMEVIALCATESLLIGRDSHTIVFCTIDLREMRLKRLKRENLLYEIQ